VTERAFPFHAHLSVGGVPMGGYPGRYGLAL
jgi:hypothetical protein